MAIHIDFINGNNLNNGSSWALAWRNFQPIAGGGGSSNFKVAKSRRVVSPVRGNFIQFRSSVQLESALTAHIDESITNTWIPASNVTASAITTAKYKTGSQRLVIAAAFTTGKIAHRTLPTVMNFSMYTKVSFLFMSSLNTGTMLNDGTLTLALCSDTDGNVPVNSFPIPGVIRANVFRAIDLTNNTALGSNIRSIAIYATVDPGTPTLTFQNFLACNDLTLCSAITLGNFAHTTDQYVARYMLRGIDNNVLHFDFGSGTANTDGLYMGVSINAFFYIYEGYFADYGQSQIVSTFGSVRGGFNIATDIQDDITVLFGMYAGNGLSVRIADNMSIFRFVIGITGTGSEYTNIDSAVCTQRAYSPGTAAAFHYNCFYHNSVGAVVAGSFVPVNSFFNCLIATSPTINAPVSVQAFLNNCFIYGGSIFDNLITMTIRVENCIIIGNNLTAMSGPRFMSIVNSHLTLTNVVSTQPVMRVFFFNNTFIIGEADTREVGQGMVYNCTFNKRIFVSGGETFINCNYTGINLSLQFYNIAKFLNYLPGLPNSRIVSRHGMMEWRPDVKRIRSSPGSWVVTGLFSTNIDHPIAEFPCEKEKKIDISIWLRSLPDPGAHFYPVFIVIKDLITLQEIEIEYLDKNNWTDFRTFIVPANDGILEISVRIKPTTHASMELQIGEISISQKMGNIKKIGMVDWGHSKRIKAIEGW